MAHGCRLTRRLSRRLFGVQRTRLNELVATQVDPFEIFGGHRFPKPTDALIFARIFLASRWAHYL